MIDGNVLREVCLYAKHSTLALWVVPVDAAMQEFEINTKKRAAAFLAQIAHESGEFRYVRELASGEDYEGRTDLGNTEPGDGVRFKGRGLIQVTGRANYSTCGRALGLDLLSEPSLLERRDYAARSAGWFWFTRGLNELADADLFRAITLKINGGLNGWQDRQMYWERAKRALNTA